MLMGRGTRELEETRRGVEEGVGVGVGRRGCSGMKETMEQSRATMSSMRAQKGGIRVLRTKDTDCIHNLGVIFAFEKIRQHCVILSGLVAIER